MASGRTGPWSPPARFITFSKRSSRPGPSVPSRGLALPSVPAWRVETEKRLEAGWLQRIVWSVLVWGSVGLLVRVPFLYAAIRRGRGSDWKRSRRSPSTSA